MNRLKLDFSLESTQERVNFIQKYLQSESFQKKPPTEEELEMCGNYILWGRAENGKNYVQNKEVQIETRNSTWNSQKETNSLEELMENPAFNEATIMRPTLATTKIKRIVFSRSEALEKAPEHLKPVLRDLFNRIDRLDLLLNYYDLKTGKRKNPPREELLRKFTEEEKNEIKEKANHINSYRYLKLRHLLVELRREQFYFKDTYSEPVRRALPTGEPEIQTTFFDADIPVFPLGLLTDQKISKRIFFDEKEFDPEDLTFSELRKISSLLWEKKEANKSQFKTYFDFRDIEHVYNFFLQYYEVEDEVMKNEIDSTIKFFIDTLNYYTARAQLTEVQREILSLKIKKWKNQDIADFINKKYGKSYTANYISTIFRQKIIKRINIAAAMHEKVIENIFFPEEFKKCTSCGRVLLKDPDNFVRKSRSKDGYSNKCKECDKRDRRRRK